MRKKLSYVGIMGLVILALFVLPSSASAITYTYTSVPGDSSVYAGISYSLNLTDADLNNIWDATLSITLPATLPIPPASEYHVGWFQIKFDGGFTAGLPTDKIYDTGGVDWLVMTAGYNPPEFGNERFPTRTWSGYYLAGLDSITYSAGPSMSSGGPYSWSFSVDMGDQSPFDETMILPIQVGFYTEGNNGNLNIARLSETVASNAVPEPATILLLGFGLVGLAGIGRKKRGA